MAFFKTYKKHLTITAIVWAAYMVVFAVIYLFVLYPEHQSKKMLDSELGKKRQLYEFAQNAAKEETKSRSLEEINILKDKLDDFTSDHRNLSNLTFHINKIARENGIDSINIESKNDSVFTEATVSKNVTENHLDISFNSEFNQFAAFLNELERNRPVLFVNEFSISRSNQSESVYKITMDIATLVRKPPITMTASQSAKPNLETEIQGQ